MEGVRRAPTVCRRVGEPIDDLQLFDDRAGPPVVHDQRQRVLVLRPDMDEVDVQAIDLGHELLKAVQRRLTPAPVVVRPPVAREVLHHPERHTL
jgi:hypothetical protein